MPKEDRVSKADLREAAFRRGEISKKVKSHLARVQEIMGEIQSAEPTTPSTPSDRVRQKKSNKTVGPSRQKDEIKNFYEVIPKKYNKKYHNPNFKKHLMNIPFRALIVGGSGSGKTNLIFEIMRRMDKTFEKVILCVKNKHEPLYEYLEEKLPKSMLEIYEGAENVPDVDKYDAGEKKQILCIFDDLVLDKDQSKIAQFFIRGRKISGGISCAYLTQSFFGTEKVIRQNCNYIFLKKLSSQRDLALIMSEFSLGVDKDELLRMYKDSTSNPLEFLMIDVDAPSEKRFRRSFLNIYPTG